MATNERTCGLSLVKDLPGNPAQKEVGPLFDAAEFHPNMIESLPPERLARRCYLGSFILKVVTVCMS